MGLPDIIIEFSKKAVTAIQNGSTGIVGIMLKDAKNKGAMVLRSVDEIPTGDSAFSAENTAYIERAFIGSPSTRWIKQQRVTMRLQSILLHRK